MPRFSGELVEQQSDKKPRFGGELVSDVSFEPKAKTKAEGFTIEKIPGEAIYNVESLAKGS